MSLKGKRILIVEDEAVIALGLEGEVGALGGEIVRADSVDSALDIIASTELDGATVDLRLRDGQRNFLVADALAARQVPFVFATGMGHREAPARHAAVPWLQKPFSPAAVSRALMGVVRQVEGDGC
jgi:CheY-like chemotaxis protein